MAAVSDAPAAPAAPSHILRYPAPGQRYAGAVDVINPAIGLRGWVVDIAVAGEPVALSAVADGVVLATAHAMMDRPDIDKLIGRVTQSSFLIGWSMFDAARLAAVAAAHPDATVDVRIDATGQLVPLTVEPLPARLALAHLGKAPRGDRQARFAEVHEYHAILASDLFDAAYYRARHGAQMAPGLPPILDYLRVGEAAGRRPNFYFDPAAYAAALGRATPRGALVAYLEAGPDGPAPGPHFDEAWYRATTAVPTGTALAHYLRNPDAGAPNPWFDRAYYVALTGTSEADAYVDFVTIGREMGFFPSHALAAAAQAGKLTPAAAAYLTAVARESDPAAPALAAGIAAPAADAAGGAAGDAAARPGPAATGPVGAMAAVPAQQGAGVRPPRPAAQSRPAAGPDAAAETAPTAAVRPGTAGPSDVNAPAARPGAGGAPDASAPAAWPGAGRSLDASTAVARPGAGGPQDASAPAAWPGAGGGPDAGAAAARAVRAGESAGGAGGQGAADPADAGADAGWSGPGGAASAAAWPGDGAAAADWLRAGAAGAGGPAGGPAFAPVPVPPPPPAAPPPPPVAIPPAARLGWHALAALFAALDEARRAATLALAEAALAAPAPSPQRADAALTLAVAHAAAGDTAAAAAAAATFLAEPPAGDPGTRAQTETAVLALAHTLYEARRPREAEAIYDPLFARGRRDDLLVLRLLEIAVDRGDGAAASRYADLLRASEGAAANPWATIAIGRALILTGRRAEATRLLAALPQFPATPAIAEAVALNLLINADAVDLAAVRAETSAGERTPALFCAHFRLAVWRQEVKAVARLAADPRAADLPNWQIGEAMFRLGAPGRLPLAQQHAVMGELYRLTLTRGLDDNAIVQARLHFLLHNKRWDELGALFQEIDGTPLGRSRETLLRKLEYTAHAGTVEDAEALYRSHFAAGGLNKWESLTVLRLLSELKRWDEAGEVLLRHVSGGYDFGTGGHIAMRVVRKARLHEATIAAASDVDGPREAGLDNFVGLVAEDMAILDRAVAMSPRPRGEEPRPASRYRSNWILEGTGGQGEGDTCMFLCTNQRYFLSALTFLTSFFGQAPQVGCRIFVFLDSDVPRNWHGMFTLVAARFNRQIEIVLEGEFVTTLAEHKVDYGFFAGGSNLARAAYYRLYAARWLLDRHDFRRALYVDTDIVCRGDLSGLFEIDFGEALLGAAIEDYSVEVVNAAGRNNLDPFKYFNSGVLALRMDDPRLGAAIDEAIRVSEVEPHRLSFHDQCALNIAFEGKFTALAPRYNFYLRPSRERNGFIEDGLLLHFVDRPKPWDIVFDRNYREEWRVWALMLGTFLPQGLYVDIFSAANRD